ncbi:DUF2971 domain-containing protein [Vibrio vulnificus]|nr:DUF2971 domain-containing protein [Vibrio vulnificus]
MKLYRFRPLNSFLFKELKYQELYCASAQELNDPLDLTASVNFYTEDEHELRALVFFVLRQGFIANPTLENAPEYLGLLTSRQLMESISNEFQRSDDNVILQSEFSAILNNFFEKLDISGFSVEKLVSRINQVISQFINNSAVSCFTENNSNFLMWSHYASSHYGICLEFDVKVKNHELASIPLMYFSKSTGKTLSYDIDIHKVNYNSPLPKLNFYNFLPAFSNSEDVDLINLSKSKYHSFGREISRLFTKKLSAWASENEWRFVDVSFKSRLPEERIYPFDIKSISGVYFGANTPDDAKNRIINIFQCEGHIPNYYQAIIDGSVGIKFQPFYYEDVE